MFQNILIYYQIYGYLQRSHQYLSPVSITSSPKLSITLNISINTELLIDQNPPKSLKITYPS